MSSWSRPGGGIVLRRHPRRAVWLGRLREYGVPLTALVVAAISALTRSWDVVPAWLLAGFLALSYQKRLGDVWSWGWRNGHDEAVYQLMPHVQLERLDLGELQDAFTAKGPTWRQRQDYLARVDHEATMRASMEQLERMWAQAPEEEA